jgi:hypothetical protein
MAEQDIDEKEPVEEEKPEKGFLAKYWMLLLGVMLCIAGIIGVVLLRTNYAQVYIFGIDDPYTGIGRVEAPGHGGAITPYVIGIILMFVWGIRAEAPVVEEEEEELEAEAPTGEFGHEHLPPHHLSAEEKIEHLSKVYAQGKISEGLYRENLAKFEAELQKEPAVEEEFGHEHLPPHHLSPDEKIAHLTKAFRKGKISKGLYERDLARFEEELKTEQQHMPPHHLSAQEKIDHLEDSYRTGKISKGTYEKNIARFNAELANEAPAAPSAPEAEPASEELKEPGAPAPAAPEAKPADLTPPAPMEVETDEKTMEQLDSLLEEIETGKADDATKEKVRKMKAASFEEKILKEIEDLEDL